MQYCPAKASKFLSNEWHCLAYTNTRVGNMPHTHASHNTAWSYLLSLQGKQSTDCGKQSRTILRGVFQ